KASSVRSYLNIIGLLHKEFGLPNPLLNNWSLNSLLTGISRSKGLTPNQKQPLTPAMLIQLHALLDLTCSHDASFWAICLVAFYGMFRKSHLLPTAATKFNPSKQLIKADFKIFSWGTLVSVRWSKTIQFRERVVDIPLPYIPGSALCPTTAITNAFKFTAPASTKGSQAFNWVNGSQVPHVFTYSAFVSKLRSHLAILGVDPKALRGSFVSQGRRFLCLSIRRPY
ncbi:hypothetical protein ACROYT_G008391, partial [Oculina patagonica]